MQVRNRGWWLLLVALPIVGVGCGESRRFNNAIVKTVNDFQRTGKELHDGLIKTKDPSAREALHQKAIKEVDKIVEQAKTIQVPDGPAAKEAWDAFQDYLKVEERVLRTDFKDLIAGTTQENLARIQTEETGVLNKLKLAMEKYTGVKAK